ncbi:hypothetical protein EDD85DRAFT_954349 [Armillaria nabsnona]|nr:hypothetical protein EDD85DRAFT_954349 [Armillaria nabsnona]
MSQIFLMDKDSKIPSTYTISTNPHLQAFNHPVGSSLLPLIVCQDRINTSFANNSLTASDISQFNLNPEKMKRPVVFDVKHGWRVFRSSLDLEEGLWLFNLSGRKPLKLTKHWNRGMTFKSGWIADVKVDIEDAITCVNFIMAHPAFIPGVPLSHHFDTNLLTTTLLSVEQACDIRSLAIIAMGELVAFINQWQVTVSSNWASNFSSAMHAFIQRIQLMCLPMRGGVFDAKDCMHGSSDDSNNVSDQILSEKDVSDLLPFLNDLQDSDPMLQSIQRLIHTAPPMYIPPQSSVFLDIQGWRAIPLPRRLWLVMCWMYDSVILPYMGPDSRYIVKFKYQQVLECALDKILSIAKRYTPTHSPGSDLIDVSTGPKLPYIQICSSLCFTLGNVSIGESSIPPVSSTITQAPGSDSGRNLDIADLVYPFNANDHNSLPVPGPIATSTLLPMDMSRESMTTSSNKGTGEQSYLSHLVFDNPETDIDSTAPPSPS